MLSLLKPPHVFGPQKSWNLETSTKLHGTSQWKTRWCQKHWCCLSLVASVCIRRWSPSTNFFWTRRWKFHWVPWTARMGLLWGMGRRPQSLSLKGENHSAIDASKLSLGRLFMMTIHIAFLGALLTFSCTLLLQISAEHFRNLEKKLQLYCIHSIYHIYVYVCIYVYNMTIDRLVW